MKSLTLLVASLAIPASVAFAQTTTPPSSSSQIPYIPLFGSGNTGGTSTTSGPSATWFIDVANNQVVMCTQSSASSGGATGGAQNFTCTAQPVPTAAAPAPSTGGTPSAPSGAAGANPLGG